MLTNFGQLYTFDIVTAATNDAFYMTTTETTVSATYLAVIVPYQFNVNESDQDIGQEKFGTVTVYTQLDTNVKIGDRVTYRGKKYTIKEQFDWEFTFKSFTAGLI